MEASFFRFLAAEIGPRLNGLRIEKVFGPAPGTWSLRLQEPGGKLHLIFRPAKSAGLLFCSALTPPNPLQAPARVMWLRKRLTGRRLLEHHVDWPGLRIAWRLSPTNRPNASSFLILDLRDDVRLADELDAAFDREPEWPPLERILDDEDIWREYPHLSPPLRRRLRALPPDEAARLLERMRGTASGACFVARQNGSPRPPLLWPEEVKDGGEILRFDSAMQAAAHHGERTLFPDLEQAENNPELERIKRGRKKIVRALAKLDEEGRKLQAMIDRKAEAEALQAELYRLRTAEGLREVAVVHPVLGPMTVALDERLSVTENMERIFSRSAKAERGFIHHARRRNELGRELAKLDAGEQRHAPEAVPGGETGAPRTLPKRYQGLAVSLFTSSDGFTIVRGKNKKANHDMLSKAASPFDYWLHAADGPSSHVILRRDFPTQEIPERTLEEAACLCALKSWRSEDTKADVMIAQVRDVRKVKGFNHGQVAVDSVLRTICVRLDPTLEERLAWK